MANISVWNSRVSRNGANRSEDNISRKIPTGGGGTILKWPDFSAIKNRGIIINLLAKNEMIVNNIIN